MTVRDPTSVFSRGATFFLSRETELGSENDPSPDFFSDRLP